MKPTPQTDQYKELDEILAQLVTIYPNDEEVKIEWDFARAKEALIQYIEKRQVESRIDELKRLKISGTPDKMTDILVEVPELTTKDDVGLISIDDRIKALTKLKEGE